MPSLTQMKEEFNAKAKNLHDLFAKYDDVASIPADEAKKIKPMNEELGVLGKAIEDAEELLGIKAGVDPSKQKSIVQVPDVATKGGESDTKVKSFAQIMAESEQYKAFKAGASKSFSFELNEAEAKTLLTLSTINNQPTRLPTIQESIQDASDISDLFLPGTLDNNTLTFMEETTFTNNAAEVAEGDDAAESALAFTERTENARVIDTWIPATRDLFTDVKGFRSYVEARLGFMVRQRRAGQLLTGNGTSPNISGILDRAIQSQAKGTDPVPDAIYKAIQKVRVTGQAEPTAVILNPNDWTDVRLLRTADGVYIWGNPSEAGPERIWGKELRQTAKLTENTGLVGAFKPHAQLFTVGGLTVTASTEHSTYFISRKVAVLAEERVLLAIYRPYAFCQVTGI